MIDPKQGGRPELWGFCARCGHSLLAEDFFCPSCGKQRDYGEVVP